MLCAEGYVHRNDAGFLQASNAAITGSYEQLRAALLRVAEA